MGSFVDLTGQVLTRLTVIRRSGTKRGQAEWECACSCGATVFVTGNDLRTGNTQSCGCLKTDVLRAIHTTHGHSAPGRVTRTWNAWGSMIARCTNPKKEKYRIYGARGITVCERWRDFANFLADMGECPPGLTLERKDVNGNYEPGNCEWASLKTQGRNRRNNRVIELAGLTATMAEWADISGIGESTISARIDMYGWSERDAIMSPVGSRPWGFQKESVHAN